MDKMEIVEKVLFFILLFVFVWGMVDGRNNWNAHKSISFHTVGLLSIVLFMMVMSLHGKVKSLEDQVDFLKKKFDEQ